MAAPASIIKEEKRELEQTKIRHKYNKKFEKDGRIFTPFLHWENMFHKEDSIVLLDILKEEEIKQPDIGRLVQCKSCGDIYDYEAHYEWLMKSSSKNKDLRLDLLERGICKVCSGIIAKRQGFIKARIKAKERVGHKNQNWQGGLKSYPYCHLFNEEFKERVREFWGRKCGITGISEVENGRRLSVHHVNYDKQTCCNENKPLFIPVSHSWNGKLNKNRKYWEEVLSNYIMIYFNGKCFNPKQEAYVC